MSRPVVKRLVRSPSSPLVALLVFTEAVSPHWLAVHVPGVADVDPEETVPLTISIQSMSGAAFALSPVM